MLSMSKNIYKSYMENGQINRGTITVPGEASFVFNGNINYDPQRSGNDEHLFRPLPAGIADDTAFHDRWAAYLPGWEMPKLTPELITNHVGFILDYTSEVFHRELRRIGHYGSLWEEWFKSPRGEWSARDHRSINPNIFRLSEAHISQWSYARRRSAAISASCNGATPAGAPPAASP